MGTTARGYRYPESTDAVRPYEGMQNLASDIDADVQDIVDTLPNGTLRCIGDSIYIRKAEATSVASDTTVNDDPHLQVTLPVGHFEMLIWLHVAAAEAGDLKVVHNFSGSVVAARSCFGPAATMTDREDTNAIFRGITMSTEQTYGIDATGSTVVHEALHIEVSSGGLWKVQWAQAASSATNTTLSTASRMRVTRLA